MLKWKDEEGQEQVMRLVKLVSAEWQDFGMLLGMDLDELRAWKSESASWCWNKVMKQWLSQGGTQDYPATWEGLYSLLKVTGFSDIAQQLEKAVVRH